MLTSSRGKLKVVMCVTAVLANSVLANSLSTCLPRVLTKYSGSTGHKAKCNFQNFVVLRADKCKLTKCRRMPASICGFNSLKLY